MSRKIIGNTVGTPFSPQAIIEKTEQAQQIEQNKKDISELSGQNVDRANSLWAVLKKTAFAETLTDAELTNFKTAWGIVEVVIPCTGITLNKTTLSFADGASQTLVATVQPSDTTNKVVWSSSNNAVATVSNGVVKPLSNGSATITATCGSVSATCSVTVAIAEEEQVTLTSISATYAGGDVTVGTSVNDLIGITVTGHYSDGSTADITGYTLSGTIEEGINIITVSYGTKTTTFVVTGVAESSGGNDGGEIVLLKSITSDGNCWIDTEYIVKDSTNTMEISASLADADKTYLMGACGYNVGTPYGDIYLYNQNGGQCSGLLNQSPFTNVGSWYNNAEGQANTLIRRQFFAVMKDGSQEIYFDEAHATKPSHYTAGSATYGIEKEYVPIPLYLFKVNKTEAVTQNYPASDCTIYFFKITNTNGDVVLNLVPAKQGSKIGMYDTVSGKFHENKGTGTFSYEELEVA